MTFMEVGFVAGLHCFKLAVPDKLAAKCMYITCCTFRQMLLLKNTCENLEILFFFVLLTFFKSVALLFLHT